jgi:hypothetical protein
MLSGSTIITTETQKEFETWIIQQTPQQIEDYIKKPNTKIHNENSPFWRLLYVYLYKCEPKPNVPVQYALQSEIYYRQACEEYRNIQSTFHLRTSNVYLLLEKSISWNPGNLLATELLLFLCRDFCILMTSKNLNIKSYGTFRSCLDRVKELADNIERRYPLIGSWKLGCIYETLLPCLASIGLDFRDRMNTKFDDVMETYFNNNVTFTQLPCEDKIEILLAPLTGLFIYKPMNKVLFLKALASKNITSFATKAYENMLAELHATLVKLENATKRLNHISQPIKERILITAEEARDALQTFTLNEYYEPETIVGKIATLRNTLTASRHLNLPCIVEKEFKECLLQLEKFDEIFFKILHKHLCNMLGIQTNDRTTTQNILAQSKPLGFLFTPTLIPAQSSEQAQKRVVELK